MKLYKNVDIKDLESIFKNGILPISICKNNNWEEGKRANNSEDKVYLFDPKSKTNSFPHYGIALIEVKINNPIKNDLVENDIHHNDYVEYTVDKVLVNEIINVYVPKIFKKMIKNKTNLTFVDIEALIYDNSFNKIKASEEILRQFAKTSNFTNSKSFNFFRGVSNNNEIIDLYDIQYLIN